MNAQDITTLKNSSYLTFNLQNDIYGINTFAVEEIFLLPELIPIPEVAPDVVGVFNWRGQILPVIDLKLRFGYETTDYTLTDSIIVIKNGDRYGGLIVNQVREVKNIAIDEITTELLGQYDRIETEVNKIQGGIARSHDEIVVLLNAEAILKINRDRALENLDLLEPESQSEVRDRPAVWREFCPQGTPETKAIFRQRAKHLIEGVEREDRQGWRSLAVIELEQELFGIDLTIVREFTDLYKITPIPCCPPHIVGNMNLRGEIVTLVDIRHILNLARLDTLHSSKATIVEVEDIIAGIVVEQVHDVILVQSTDIQAVPTAIHTIDDEYLLGTVSYQEKMLALLDIAKILLKGDLVVNESLS
ncbi:MAG: chemotaxis protein CheW [Jaaginema sp. PMC 1079.18]|nr:chemotaxis protein CheW [Jaaginema sp. PMC 1080.18]MEC4853060.1 chemotaxis protein CheW [Jaaginema sp. PMC 1079.18]MEC4865881.1 chemotaxis protein CheW [Jaaginema sp. PMC 1078.18]